MVNFAYIHTRWTRTSERICPVKFETRTKASIINDYSGNRNSQAENIGKLLPSIGQAYRQVYACWVQFEKDSGNFNARWTWNIEMVLSLSFFLLFHCSSNSIKLWNNCNSFIQSRDRCNFMKLVKKISKYIG